VGLAALAVTVTATLAFARGHSATQLAAADALPASPAPAFAIPRPRALETSPHAARWAPVLRAVPVRAKPERAAPVVARLAVQTPERTTNIALVRGRRQDRAGRTWLQVRAPALPANVDGWVPRSALGGYTLVGSRLVVDLERLRATLYENGKLVFRAPVGIGTPESPTPRGEFYVRNVLTAYNSPFYGPIAFGTSARSPVLTDWPAGGFVGVHGTDRPDLLPGRVSHGCIRMRNADIVRLAELMPVGTPLTIR
jgi:lipoprotein-anchoring transpeptidase ErfK/SrfK